jgi:hypothetical protein
MTSTTVSAKATPQDKVAKQKSDARKRIANLHELPDYNLATEQWLPIITPSGIEKVGLREFFIRAHEIRDVAIPNPLLRAATRRYLIALTADIVNRDRQATQKYWKSAHEKNSGFTETQVEATLTAHANHLYLWHPETPFLQDMRLLACAVDLNNVLPMTDMVLHLPSGSSMAWWVKPGEPALKNDFHPDVVALLLIARWFYAPNGNCGAVTLLDGKTVVTSHAGGAFAETITTITHAFRVDPDSMFRTLLRGMPKALVDQDRIDLNKAIGGCAWLDANQPQDSPSPLYRATLNPAMVLLADRDDEGKITGWLRGSAPIPGKDAKSLRDGARNADQHRILRELQSGKTEHVTIKPGAVRAEIVRQFHRDAQRLRQLIGVVNGANCFIQPDQKIAERETLDMFLVSKNASSASPVWEEMIGVELPALYVDPSNPSLAKIREVVGVAFDPKQGAQALLERAIAELLAQNGPKGYRRPTSKGTTGLDRTYRALRNKAVNEWLGETATEFETALRAASTSLVDIDKWRYSAYKVALAVFDRVAAPYLTTIRYAPRYAKARSSLAHKARPQQNKTDLTEARHGYSV